MTTDDPDLFDQFAQRRDEASFRKLYRQYAPMLFALALRLSGSRDGAQDLVQETWIRAVEGLAGFRHQSKYSTWLTGILVNCSREAWRRQARAPTQLDNAAEPAVNEVVTPFPTAFRSPADCIDIERALSNLPAGYREIVILHDINGYTHPEIAAMLGIEAGTSKSQLARGRARLRELLSNKSPPQQNSGERGTQ